MKQNYVNLAIATVFFFSLLTACRKTEHNDPLPVSSASRYSNDVATDWNDMSLRLIRTTPGFTPPVAARALGYTGVTLYESVVPGISGYRPMKDVLGYTYTLPSVDRTAQYNWAIAANAAMRSMVLNMFESTSEA